MSKSAYGTHLHTSQKAGVEAVYATITNFILAMMSYPEAQRNAGTVEGMFISAFSLDIAIHIFVGL
jgi:hypothetical protein